MALVPLMVAPVIVPEAAMVVAPAIAPVLVIPPALLSMPPVMLAPFVTVSPPFKVCSALKVFDWFLYATLESVPAVLMSTPLIWSAETALITLVLNVAVVPLSVKDARVLVSPSLMVRAASAPAVPSVMVGALFVKARGAAPERVTVLLAAIVVAPAIAPVGNTASIIVQSTTDCCSTC